MSSDSDEGSPSASEGKSSTVCFLCRQRKTKCDRKLPKCTFCIKAKVECQYVPKPKKRGLRAGYVSELESRLERLEGEVSTLKQERTLASFHTPTSQHSIATDVPGLLPPPETPTLSITEPPPKRRRRETESDAAIKDLASLPMSYIVTLAELWFKETQPWVPILSYQHIQSALQQLAEPVEFIDDLVLRAVVSLQISHSTQAIVLGYKGRHRISQHLRSSVMTEAMSSPSLNSIRALVIIAFLDYGNDNIPSVFNILSMCRRTAEHLGLFGQLLRTIESESPSQVGPPSRTAFDGVDGNKIAVAWCIMGLDAVSSLGVPWRDVSAALVDHLSSVAYVSTPDLRDSFKAHVHLSAIGLQPVHTFIHEFANGPPNATFTDYLVKCDEMYNNLISYVHNQPQTSYTLLADGGIDFDPCLVHTSVLAHAAVIMIYQVLIDFTDGLPAVAIERCQQACEAMVMTIRSISDADAELNTPLLANFFFIAARFKLIMYRALSQEREISFDTLMHGINMCGRRWAVARRLDIVLRCAIAEVEPGAPAALPADFWNLKRSSLDISEQVKQWIHQYKPNLYVGSLNGPYV